MCRLVTIASLVPKLSGMREFWRGAGRVTLGRVCQHNIKNNIARHDALPCQHAMSHQGESAKTAKSASAYQCQGPRRFTVVKASRRGGEAAQRKYGTSMAASLLRSRRANTFRWLHDMLELHTKSMQPLIKMESKLLFSDTTFCQNMIEGWPMAGLIMTGIVIEDAHDAISITSSLQ